MGNDGGSIPKRTELVKTKKKAVKSDNSEKLISKWHFCALSKAILSMPVVVCALGKLYNKEAILEHLINGSASKYGDSDKICPHVTSMSHIKELNLTENPTFDKTKSSSSPFICPLNQKVMNGNLPFVYISKCGCVFSKAGIKDLRGTEMKCPLCSKAYEEADITDINPPEETQTELLLKIEEKIKQKKMEKLKNKKKGNKNNETEIKIVEKRKGTATEEAIEAIRNKKKSKAIESIFTSSSSKEQDRKNNNNYLCRGTFNRYS